MDLKNTVFQQPTSLDDIPILPDSVLRLIGASGKHLENLKEEKHETKIKEMEDKIAHIMSTLVIQQTAEIETKTERFLTEKKKGKKETVV